MMANKRNKHREERRRRAVGTNGTVFQDIGASKAGPPVAYRTWRANRGQTFGPASPVRRIDPKAGAVIEEP